MAKKKQVRIRIKPLHGIGGVGVAGDTAWMDLEEANQYEKDGYLEILPDADEPTPSTVAGEQILLEEANDEETDEANDEETNDQDADEGDSK